MDGIRKRICDIVLCTFPVWLPIGVTGINAAVDHYQLQLMNLCEKYEWHQERLERLDHAPPFRGIILFAIGEAKRYHTRKIAELQNEILEQGYIANQR